MLDPETRYVQRAGAPARRFRRAARAALIGSAALCAGDALAGSDAASKCDQALAVPWERIDAAAAMSACGTAAMQDPENARRQTQYARSLLKGDKPRDAAAVYRKAAGAGYVPAQYTIGYLYENGTGVDLDFSEAARWYRVAAEKRHSFAQYRLGNLYLNGKGVPKDPAQAAKWYREAGLNGEIADAQFRLGWLYYNGSGVPKNNRMAVEWVRKAAVQGHAQAQAFLGAALEEGTGVSRNLKLARNWYEAAANQGFKFAAERLTIVSAQIANEALNGPPKKQDKLVIAPPSVQAKGGKAGDRKMTAGEALVGLAIYGVIYGMQNGSFKDDGLASSGSNCYPGAFSCNVDTNNYMLWEAIR